MAPDGFDVQVSVDSLAESIIALATFTAKTDGMTVLKNNVPNSDTSNITWLAEPKKIFYSEPTTDAVSRWFFVFESPQGHYVQMVVSDDNQVTELDANLRQKP